MGGNLKRLMAIRNRNKEKKESSGSKLNLPQKNLRDGENKFRGVGEIHIVFEHWFTAADGTRVHSICTRNYDDEMEGNEPAYCPVCKEYKAAWDIYNDSEQYSEEELHEAMIMIGKAKSKGAKFESSWKAKEFGYLDVIDKEDDWCRENESCKVLSKSESQPGISAGNGGILDEIIELADEYGDYEAYDIRIKKTGKMRDTAYRGYKGKESELTPEEKSYKRHDFPTLLKPTPENVITRWLTEGVKDKDKDDNKESDEKSNEESSSEEKSKSVKTVQKDETSKVAKKTTVKLKTKKPEPEPEPEPATDEDMAECPECEAMIPVTSNSCPKCGIEFEGVED